MALFRRNKTDQAGMPTEVQDYYKAEGRERTWVAWLLAIATLFITVVVVLAIFYGGRWTFRKLKGSNKPATVAVQTEEPKDQSGTSTPSSQTNNTPAGAGALPTPPQSSGSSPSAASSNQQSINNDLPETGPGDTFAVFVAVSVLAYATHRYYLGKTYNK